MKETPAQRRAKLEYKKRHMHQFVLAFYPKDEDLWEYLQRKEKKAEYLRELIREDMERHGER